MPCRDIDGREAEHLRSADTGYFSLVMSTGIISVSLLYHGYDALSRAMFYVAVAAYVCLASVFAARAVFFTSGVRSDFRHVPRLFGFFNIITASSLLLTREGYQAPYGPVIYEFLFPALLFFWALLSLASASAIFTARRGSLQWPASSMFTIMVAAESLSILATGIYRQAGVSWPLYASIFLWSAGICLYVPVNINSTARAIRKSVLPDEGLGTYWINMGGSEIVALAGILIIKSGYSALWPPLFQIVNWATVIFLAYGTAWFPAAGWISIRSLRSSPSARKYRASKWSMVFPIGMYSTASYLSSGIIGIPFLAQTSYYVLALGLGLWSLLAYMLLAGLLKQGPRSG